MSKTRWSASVRFVAAHLDIPAILETLKDLKLLNLTPKCH